MLVMFVPKVALMVPQMVAPLGSTGLRHHVILLINGVEIQTVEIRLLAHIQM